MNLDDVALFVQVVEQGSFTKAAELSGLPKSTVSRRIRDLEQSLRARLLERTTRHLLLTEVGEAFLLRARAILAAVEATELEVAGAQQTFEGELTLYAPDFLMEWCSPQIARFFDSYPELSLRVHDIGQTSSTLADKRFDLLLTLGALRDSSFIAHPMAKLQFDLYATPEYLQQHPLPEHPQILGQGHALAIMELASLDLCWPLAKIPLFQRPRFCTQSPYLLRSLVLQHKVIGYLPVAMAGDLVTQGKLVPLYNRAARTAEQLYGVYHSRRFVPEKVKLLMEDIRAGLPGRLQQLEAE
ncbi:LysR family transcriptional regulator [Shewanella sp. 3B26]|uniref:LysR family transcriptional regulator n=1 Tax=Shewanella zhuhaiensis TaxID=2919576 RepID=A0AAJ1F0W2_9GAMM|nr:LysR family transcriptional regulator [Shewanella zhuhaiensis]MCH4294888.1 LysR family transcriptional regulator [Shewanella zhuhaiensis]